MIFFVWIVAVLILVVLEFVELFRRGTPLTQVYLRLSCNKWLRMLFFGLFTWVIWHWMIQPFLPMDTNGMVVLDILAIAPGVIGGYFVGPPKWGVDCDEPVGLG